MAGSWKSDVFFFSIQTYLKQLEYCQFFNSTLFVNLEGAAKVFFSGNCQPQLSQRILHPQFQSANVDGFCFTMCHTAR
jgi:hypothetical protein